MKQPRRDISELVYWSGMPVLALALVLALWTGAKLFWQLMPVAEPEVSIAPPTSGNGSAVRQADGVDIADLHLFGQAGAEVRLAEIEAPETQLNLELLGTFAADDPTAGLAIVADEEGRQGYYGAGDELPGGASLREIHVDRVVIERQGRLESLRLNRENTDSARGNRGRAMASDRDREDAGGPRSLSEVDWQQARNQSRLDLEKMKQLGQQIRALPHIENGKPIGVRLMSGANSAAVRKLGLRNSDIILSVNGIPLSDPSRQFELMNLLNEQSRFQVRVRRNGREMTLNVDASQLQTP